MIKTLLNKVSLSHQNKNTNKPFTAFAKVNDGLLRNAFRDVDLSPQTCNAHVGWIGLNWGTTLATQTEGKKYEIRHPVTNVVKK